MDYSTVVSLLGNMGQVDGIVELVNAVLKEKGPKVMEVLRTFADVVYDEETIKIMARGRALYFKELIAQGIAPEYAIQLAVGSIQTWTNIANRIGSGSSTSTTTSKR